MNKLLSLLCSLLIIWPSQGQGESMGDRDHYRYEDRIYGGVDDSFEAVVYLEGDLVYRTARMISQDECGRRGALAKSYWATSETLLEVRCDDGFVVQTPRLNSLLRQEGRYACAREHSSLYALYFDFKSSEPVGRHKVRVECGVYDYAP